MKTIAIAPTFTDWRDAARAALAADLAPEFLLWEERDIAQSALFAEETPRSSRRSAPRVPADFLEIAKRVTCHRDPERWALLYTALWRITHGEPHLLEIAVDPLTRRLQEMDKAVRHDVH